VPQNRIGLSRIQRNLLRLSLGEAIYVKPFRTMNPNIYIQSMSLGVDFLTKNGKGMPTFSQFYFKIDPCDSSRFRSRTNIQNTYLHNVFVNQNLNKKRRKIQG
jgi:hypothetical protein